MATKGVEPPLWTKFALAGAGGFSGWCFVHPFDVIKASTPACRCNETFPIQGVAMLVCMDMTVVVIMVAAVASTSFTTTSSCYLVAWIYIELSAG